MYLNRPIFNPVLPFVSIINDGLHPGYTINIEGSVNRSGKMFQVNLMLGEAVPDIAFHYNPRLSHVYVARNTMHSGAWGKEESDSPNMPFPFQTGQNFSIMILVELNQFRVSVNGRHFVNYKHRIPFVQITTLKIHGDIEISKVEIQNQQLYLDKYVKVPADPSHPQVRLLQQLQPSHAVYDPEVPFSCQIPGNMNIGKVIFISGRPTYNGTRFSINLLCSFEDEDLSQNDSPDIAFHFNPRFKGPHPRIVVRNSRIHGNWGTEEILTPQFDFNSVCTFDIIIYCEAEFLVFYVNGKYFGSYKHRVPYLTIGTLEINGDVNIIAVIFK